MKRTLRRSVKQREQEEKHLKPNQFEKGRSSEQAAAAGRKGGIASGESRRAHKTYREIAQALRDELVEVKMPNGAKREIPLDEAVMLGLYRKALSGDHNAVKLLLEIQGEYQNSLDLSAHVDAPSVIVGDDDTAKKLREILARAKKEQEQAQE